MAYRAGMARLARLVRSLLQPPRSPGWRPTGHKQRRSASRGDSVRYAPVSDGLPDPGEVVWAWVPYEDDASRGKDRPVLLVGREDGQLLGLALSSQDHDLDAADEARYGRYWMDVGTGDWDSQRRPSEVRLDRLIRLDADSVRREGAALDRTLFERVVAAARKHNAL